MDINELLVTVSDLWRWGMEEWGQNRTERNLRARLRQVRTEALHDLYSEWSNRAEWNGPNMQNARENDKFVRHYHVYVVTKDEVRIGKWIYWTLIKHNYK
jgi:hypothetical protein